MECPICTDKFNLSTRKPIECQYCKFAVCRDCVKRYITMDTRDPQCTSCKAVWDREVLETVMTKVFMTTDYRDHRKDILLERAKARMPEYQQKAHNELAARGIDQLCETLKGTVRELQDKIYELNEEIRRQMRDAVMLRTGRAAVERERAENKFVRGCPKEGCRGFLNQRYVCGICDTKCCSKCHVIKTEEHECNADDVATAELLKKDTKSCPKCSIPIFKIDGCDQMWCPECKTAFSWRTGQVETGRVHNPHYYEWMRQNGTLPREPGDVPEPVCNENVLPSSERMSAWLLNTATYEDRYHYNRSFKSRSNGSKMMHIHRVLTHIHHVNIRTYEREIAEYQRMDDIFVKYLLNELSDDDLKKELIQRERDTQKATAMLQVFQMLYAASVDVINQSVRNIKVYVQTDAIPVITQLNQIREFANSAFIRYKKIYDCTPPYITDDWEVASYNSKIRAQLKVASESLPLPMPTI